MKAIPRKDFVPNENSNSSVVCALHFLDSDFSCSTPKRRRLKPDAVPSVFSICPQPKKRRKSERHCSISVHQILTPTMTPKEGHEVEASQDFCREDICTSVVPTDNLASRLTTPTQPSPGDSDATHQAAVSVESAAQTHSLTPLKHCVVVLHRLESQGFRINSNIRKPRKNYTAHKLRNMKSLYSLRIEITKELSFDGLWTDQIVSAVGCKATGTTVSSKVYSLSGADTAMLSQHLEGTTPLQTLILNTDKTQADAATMTLQYFQDERTKRHFVDLLVVDSMLAIGQKILARLKPVLDGSPATGIQAPPSSENTSGATSPANGASQSGAACSQLGATSLESGATSSQAS